MQQATHSRLHVRDAHDAHVLFEAVRQGFLKPVTRRLNEMERSLHVRSGAIFVWVEGEDDAGLKRWTGNESRLSACDCVTNFLRRSGVGSESDARGNFPCAKIFRVFIFCAHSHTSSMTKNSRMISHKGKPNKCAGKRVISSLLCASTNDPIKFSDVSLRGWRCPTRTYIVCDISSGQKREFASWSRQTGILSLGCTGPSSKTSKMAFDSIFHVC